MKIVSRLKGAKMFRLLDVLQLSTNLFSISIAQTLHTTRASGSPSHAFQSTLNIYLLIIILIVSNRSIPRIPTQALNDF